MKLTLVTFSCKDDKDSRVITRWPARSISRRHYWWTIFWF